MVHALNRGGTGYSGEGYVDGGEPTAEYLQATLAIESIWLDLEKYIKQTATAINLPWSVLELEYSDSPSGVSLIIKAAPFTGAGQAARADQMAEVRLAKTILTATGNHYGQAGLAEQAETLQLLLAWAEPHPDSWPGPRHMRRMGDASWDQVAHHRLHGTVRTQPRSAPDHLEQVAEDEADAAEVGPANSRSQRRQH